MFNYCPNNNLNKYENSKFHGDCCNGFIHQQFTLEATFNNTAENPLVVYEATPFPINTLTERQNNEVFPFGTVKLRNLSQVPVTYEVLGEVEEVISREVGAGSEGAITAHAISLVTVSVNYPTDPIRVLFLFDIFFPTGPIIPEDPTIQQI